jgi:hypothetical protein
MQKEINRYKGQDTQKKLFCGEKFIAYFFVIELLNKSLLKCFYCNTNKIEVKIYLSSNAIKIYLSSNASLFRSKSFLLFSMINFDGNV